VTIFTLFLAEVVIHYDGLGLTIQMHPKYDDGSLVGLCTVDTSGDTWAQALTNRNTDPRWLPYYSSAFPDTAVGCSDPLIYTPPGTCIYQTESERLCASLHPSVVHYIPCSAAGVSLAEYYNACLADACVLLTSGLNSTDFAATLLCEIVKGFEQQCRKFNVSSFDSQIDECGVCFGDGSTCRNDFASCQSFGSGSVRTFDGVGYFYPGSCEYTFVRLCTLRLFEVQVRFAPCVEGSSCIVAVAVKVDSLPFPIQIVAKRSIYDAVLYGADAITSFPHVFIDGSRLEAVGETISLYLLPLGIIIDFSMSSVLVVYLPDVYFGQVAASVPLITTTQVTIYWPAWVRP